jgi:hypothetical protein
MTADEFTSVAVALLRSSVGWQSAIARRLDVDSRIVRRWLKDGQTPPWVDRKLSELIGAQDISPWPRDEWLIGDAVTADGRRREYIVHLEVPRFVARIVDCDDTGPCPHEEPADTVSGTVYVVDGDDFGETVLCEVNWIDDVPVGQMTQLLEAAADVIDEQNRRDAS